MFRHGNPHNFGAVSQLQITDEFNRPVNPPRTVEEANGINTEQPEATTPEQIEAQAAPVDKSAKDYARRLATPLWEGIQNYKFPNDEDLRTRQSELFSELLAIIEHAGAYFADAHTAQMAVLESEHESVRCAIREAVARREELASQIAASDDDLRRAQGNVSSCRLKFNELKAGEPTFYPSKSEISAWEKKLESARKNLDAALASEREIVSVREGFASKIAEQSELLGGHKAHYGALNDSDRPGLIQRERELKAQLEGKEWTDSTTGLSSKAGTLL